MGVPLLLSVLNTSRESGSDVSSAFLLFEDDVALPGASLGSCWIRSDAVILLSTASCLQSQASCLFP